MKWPLNGLRWSFCATIAWSSLQTFLEARAGHDLHALLLSSVELIAIAAFLFERLAVPACVVLVTVFALAATLTALEGQVPLRFLYFAATAVYLVLAQRTQDGQASGRLTESNAARST